MLRQSTQYLYDWSDGYSTTYNEEATETEYEYDLYGNLIRKKSSYYIVYDNIQNSAEYSYKYIYDTDDNTSYKTSFFTEELDEDGLLIKSTNYVNDELVSWTEYKYK